MVKRIVYDDGEDLIYVDFEKTVCQTDKARLVRLADRNLWIPESAIGDEGSDTLGLKRWFAEKNGLA